MVRIDCQHHGPSLARINRRKGEITGYSCARCHAAATRRWYGRNYKAAVAYKGHKCVQCGYAVCTEAFRFYDPSEGFVKMKTLTTWRTFERLKPALDKCRLICSNCAAELDAGLLTIT